jgi:hypothetical protein
LGEMEVGGWGKTRKDFFEKVKEILKKLLMF